MLIHTYHYWNLMLHCLLHRPLYLSTTFNGGIRRYHSDLMPMETQLSGTFANQALHISLLNVTYANSPLSLPIIRETDSARFFFTINILLLIAQVIPVKNSQKQDSGGSSHSLLSRILQHAILVQPWGTIFHPADSYLQLRLQVPTCNHHQEERG